MPISKLWTFSFLEFNDFSSVLRYWQEGRCPLPRIQGFFFKCLRTRSDGSGSGDAVLTKTKRSHTPSSVSEESCPNPGLHPSSREVRSSPLPTKSSTCLLGLALGGSWVQLGHLECQENGLSTLGPPGAFSPRSMVGSEATPKALKLHRSFNELAWLLGSSFSKYLISDFPSAPGISCTDAADFYFLPGRPPLCVHAANFQMSSVNSCSPCLSPAIWEPRRLSSHPPALGIPYCGRTYVCKHLIILPFLPPSLPPSSLPSSKPLIVFSRAFILQLLRDLYSHVACLPLCLLSPVSWSIQGTTVT